MADEQVAAPSKPEMRDIERILIGAIGAGAVAVVTYPASSGYMEMLLDNPDPAFYLAYFVRLLGFVAIGGFWAFLHKSEVDRMKVFQIGVVAPAMLAGLLYANKPPEPRHDQSAAVPAKTSQINTNERGSAGWSLISRAYAQGVDSSKKESKPGTFTQRFIKGLWGK